MKSTLPVITIALVFSFAAPTMLQRNQAYPSYYPYYPAHGYNQGFGPLFHPAAAAASPVKIENVSQRKVLGVIDLILIAQLSARVAQLEQKVTDLSSSQGNTPTTIGAIPASCDDLVKLGNTKSGLYNIKSSGRVATVYCDFTIASGDSGFEQLIGYADVQSVPVYFYVQTAEEKDGDADKLLFDTEVLNVGSAMDKTTGIFKAPVDGTYFFSFTGTALVGSAATVTTSIELQLNDVTVGTTQINQDPNGTGAGAGQSSLLHTEATISLKKDDTVSLKYTTAGPILAADGKTYFTGMLLAENNFP